MKGDAKADRFRAYGIPKILMITIYFFLHSSSASPLELRLQLFIFASSASPASEDRDTGRSEWNKASIKGRRIIFTTFFTRFLVEIALMSEPSMPRFFPFVNSSTFSYLSFFHGSSPCLSSSPFSCHLNCTSMDESVINVMKS